jgi:hypothetical protein
MITMPRLDKIDPMFLLIRAISCLRVNYEIAELQQSLDAMTRIKPVKGHIFKWGLRAIHQRLLGVCCHPPWGAFVTHSQ